ncbi:MAG: sugar ABC transporter permease [Propionibacteriaceae bacterium]|jgi:multiple sugar transport system permease protein/alpha-1,4-digalacturonate transport system permease protein|nr:sugar ABC transporter permease [Propionibacteriaceae bacterium]
MTTATTTARPVRRRSRLRRRNTLLGLSFIAPNFIGFAVITLVPILILFYVAFTQWYAVGTPKWTGLANFRKLFLHDSTFIDALINTLYYTAAHLPLTLAASLGLAVLLNRKMRGMAFFRTAAFFPYVTSIVAIALVWNLMFSPDTGPINQLLRFIGLSDPPGWTVSSTWAMPAVIIVGTWREMGYYMLLFLAGLQTIPAQLYEAAQVDGASAWSRFWHITLPGLRPTTFFITVMLTIESMKVFDLVFVMTAGGPGTSTLVISQLIWRRAFEGEGEFGYASAIALVLFVICLGFTLVQFVINRRSEK